MVYAIETIINESGSRVFYEAPESKEQWLSFFFMPNYNTDKSMIRWLFIMWGNVYISYNVWSGTPFRDAEITFGGASSPWDTSFDESLISYPYEPFIYSGAGPFETEENGAVILPAGQYSVGEEIDAGIYSVYPIIDSRISVYDAQRKKRVFLCGNLIYENRTAMENITLDKGQVLEVVEGIIKLSYVK